eukprot:12899052-Prorocentrum_lima.AAC.1
MAEWTRWKSRPAEEWTAWRASEGAGSGDPWRGAAAVAGTPPSGGLRERRRGDRRSERTCFRCGKEDHIVR